MTDEPLLHPHADREAYAHAYRVAALAASVGRLMKVSDGEMLRLERAALVHDVGKLAMPEAVLRKPAPLTVEENLRIGAASRGNDEVPMWIDDLFPVLRTMRARRGGDLSGGQQQQLAFGRALMAAPKLLILDEPTEGIQPSIIEEIGRVIRRLAQERGLAILLCEQYYDFAKRLADTYAVMSRGEIVASGPGSEMDAKDVRALIAV